MSILSTLSAHRRATVAGAIVLVLLVLGGYVLFRPSGTQYVTAVAARGDIQQTVEAVGTVTSEHDLALQFPASGIVSEVDVQQGDRVEMGQVLARLRAGNFAAAVAIQSAALQVAQANLQKVEEGMRPQDLAIAQANVANKQAALQAAQSAYDSSSQNLLQAQDQLTTLQQEADTSLLGQANTAKSSISTQLVTAETALASVQGMLTRTEVNDAIALSKPGQDATINMLRSSALDSIAKARSAATIAAKYQDVLMALQSAQSALNDASSVVDQMYALIDSLTETQFFNSSVREADKASLSAQRASIQGALGTLTSVSSSLQSASAGYDTRISAAQAAVTADQGAKDKASADVLTYKTALQAQQADLVSKQAPPRDTDLATARAQVQQASAALAQAASLYDDTVLRAPVSGVITNVNIKAGESLPMGAAIALLGDTPFRVQIDVSEVDVPKLAVSASGTIDLDAFPDVHYKVRLSEVDTSPTLVDGVSKYQAKLDFVFPHPELKIGMTGDVTILTGERKNVITIPGRAVITKATGQKTVRILGKNKTVTEQSVTTGMEGQSGDVEVTSGLSGGETIVVLTK